MEIALQRLSKADDNFNKSISTIFSLASKAHYLFKSLELEEIEKNYKYFISELGNGC